MKKLLIFLFAALFFATPALALTEEEMASAVQEAGEAALAACIEEDMTDLEKLTALHDWMCLTCDYGATLRATTVYGALAEGRAVCTGYASAYAYLAELAGLEGAATYSPEMDHAWILVTLDGARYFSDCTWDDGKKAKLGLIRHSFWLFDEANAWETGAHYGWDSLENVPGGALETAPWSAAMTRVIFSGDDCWYIDEEFRLWRCDRDTWETELLFDREDRWPLPDGEDSSRDGLYSGLILLDGRLYFNTPYAICSVDTDGQNLQIVLEPDTSEGVIYGLGVQNGNICYSIASEPDAVVYDVIDSGISAGGAWGYEKPAPENPQVCLQAAVTAPAEENITE